MIVTHLQKNKAFFLFTLCMVVISLMCMGCKTPTDVDTLGDSDKTEAPVTVVEPVPEVPPVPQEELPFEISFATSLQQTLQNGSVEEALELFDEIPSEYAEDKDINFLHASLLLSAGNLNDASNVVSSLQASNPDDTDLQLLQALILKEQGNLKGSRALIEDILKKDPTNIDANVEMANIYMTAKNFRLANQHFVAGLRSDPEDPASLFGHGLTSWYLRNDDAAKDAFNNLVEVEPENSLAWSYLAKLSSERGKYADAVQQLETAIKYEPDYFSHWLDLGSVYLKMFKREDAEKAWTRAIEINPTYFLGYAYRGGLRDEMGDYDGALDDYNNVVKYNPNYYFAYESIGMLYWKDEQWVDSRNAFLRAYEADPDNISYALLISATYQKENNRLANQEFLREAMKTVDRSSLDYQMMRLYYDGLGDNAVLQKVVNEDSTTTRGKMLFYMAVFYEIKGLEDLANKYYIEVTDMQAPMFFEYRFCEWAVEEMQANNVTY